MRVFEKVAEALISLDVRQVFGSEATVAKV